MERKYLFDKLAWSVARLDADTLVCAEHGRLLVLRDFAKVCELQVSARAVRRVAVVGDCVFAGTFDGELKLLQYTAGQLRLVAETALGKTEVKGLDVARRGDALYVLAACRNENVWLFKVPAAAPQFQCVECFTHHAQDVKSVSWHPTQLRFVSGGFDGRVVVCAFAAGSWRVEAQFEQSETVVFGVLWVGNTLLSVASDGAATLYAAGAARAARAEQPALQRAGARAALQPFARVPLGPRPDGDALAQNAFSVRLLDGDARRALVAVCDEHGVALLHLRNAAQSLPRVRVERLAATAALPVLDACALRPGALVMLSKAAQLFELRISN